MSIDLSNYKKLECALLIRISIAKYKLYENGYAQEKVLLFSDARRSITTIVNGVSEEYTGLGNFLSITSTRSELRSSSSTLSIGLSGIPNSSISEIMNSSLKGSPISVSRCLINPTTNEVIDIIGRFYGTVNNYSIDESFDNSNASNTITLYCSSLTDQLAHMISGRRTNPDDQKRYWPGDISMDRVQSLMGANFDFGAPKSTKVGG